MAEDNNPIIDLRNVSMAFAKRDGEPLLVLDGINVSIHAGEIVGLLGRSGSGKSTLLRIAAGLIKPTSGEVVYRGVPLTEPTEGIAVVFQTFALFPWLTVLENVEAGLDALDCRAHRLVSARRTPSTSLASTDSSPRIRANCRAECVNASASPEPRRQGPTCC